MYLGGTIDNLRRVLIHFWFKINYTRKRTILDHLFKDVETLGCRHLPDIITNHQLSAITFLLEGVKGTWLMYSPPPVLLPPPSCNSSVVVLENHIILQKRWWWRQHTNGLSFTISRITSSVLIQIRIGIFGIILQVKLKELLLFLRTYCHQQLNIILQCLTLFIADVWST